MGTLYGVSWHTLIPLVRHTTTTRGQRLRPTSSEGGWQLTASTSMGWRRWGGRGSRQGASQHMNAPPAATASACLAVLQRLQVLGHAHSLLYLIEI